MTSLCSRCEPVPGSAWSTPGMHRTELGIEADVEQASGGPWSRVSDTVVSPAPAGRYNVVAETILDAVNSVAVKVPAAR
jgi:hypothetical protein